MAIPGAPRDDIDIPDRPTASSRAGGGGMARWRPFLYGAAGAGAVVVVAVVALSLFGSHETVVGGGEVPLIKPEDAPIKVSPDTPGGMNVPNRGLLVYEQMQKQPDAKHPAGKPPVERLLPDPEEPMALPQTLPRDDETTQAPEPVSPDDDATGPLLTPPETSPGDRQSLDQLIATLPPQAPETSRAAPPVAAVTPVPAERQPAVERPAPAPTVAQPKALPPAKPAQPASVPAENSPSPAKKGGYVVQLYAGRSADEAKAAWSKIRGRNGDLLGGLTSSVARADLGDRGTFYRLRAGPLENEAKARALCAALGGRGQSCIIVRSGA